MTYLSVHCPDSLLGCCSWVRNTDAHTHRYDLVLMNPENVTNMYIFPLNSFEAGNEILKRGRLLK